MEFSDEAVLRFSAGDKTQAELFNALLSPECLYEAYEAKFKKSSAKGVDRTAGSQFSANAVNELVAVSRKVGNMTFRFSPYLESLKAKGRSKPPRLIGIPTIRDRIVLCQLNRFLAAIFPACVPKNVASGYVRMIAEDISKAPLTGTWVCGTDIKSFYDDIPRDKLIEALAVEVNCDVAIALVRHALETPIVPSNTARSDHAGYRTKKGVPQGLAISNLLAAIYLADVDKALRAMPVSYFRYVDDALIYGSKANVNAAHSLLGSMLAAKGLSLHDLESEKTSIVEATSQFSYLGYVFKLPLITVRDSTIERFLQAVAAKFTDFKYGKNRLIKKFDYLDESRVMDIFLLELNEKITGAVSENKRYGWISYFNQINDLTLLARMDLVISRMFGRLPEFSGKAPKELKTLHRSYYEMKYRATGGYVHNYDLILDRTQKLVFLVERGRIGPREQLTDDEIAQRYEVYRARVLKEMNADEGVVY